MSSDKCSAAKNSNRRCFARPPKFRNRMIMMLCGVTAQGMGLSLLRSINLGTDPCSCLTQGVTNFLPLSFGTCQLLCHLVTFLFVIRYDLGMIGFGTIGNMCFLGYISDFFRWGWALLLPAGFFEGVANRYILLIPSLAVFLLGAAAYMCAGLGSSPYHHIRACEKGLVQGRAHVVGHRLYGGRVSPWRRCRHRHDPGGVLPGTDHRVGTAEVGGTNRINDAA